ncbi:MAG: DUF3524 domain-containing protein [Candidatus Zixiibacteriota bacterium]|nr:MAG: DUF3524 domain-containing protein [candidate division Zixibacteria bacterium]
MNVLALEPYYNGSHRAFLDGWQSRSRHQWTILGLPCYKWKWRMRHSAVTFAEKVNQQLTDGHHWDAIFCSDMLNLAEFLGLVSPHLRQLPTVVYFHENQLTYPDRHQQERDLQFAFTNFTTALAATGVWFNSRFHQDSFLEGLRDFLSHMPDYKSLELVDSIEAKARIYSPGVDTFPVRKPRKPGPLRILWAARWEHDKDPDCFFEALKLLQQSGADFRLSVIGPQFQQIPSVFELAHEHFSDYIDHWGYQQSRSQYEAALIKADVIVSTAQHEFFGISVVEAISAGAYPLLPNRLAYPELLGGANTDEFFYDGSPEVLTKQLISLTEHISSKNDIWGGNPDRARTKVARFQWNTVSSILDNAFVSLVDHHIQ